MRMIKKIRMEIARKTGDAVEEAKRPACIWLPGMEQLLGEVVLAQTRKPTSEDELPLSCNFWPYKTTKNRGSAPR